MKTVMSLFVNFYRAMLHRAQLCHSMSVCPSVTFRYWSSSKIISAVSVAFLN